MKFLFLSFAIFVFFASASADAGTVTYMCQSPGATDVAITFDEMLLQSKIPTNVDVSAISHGVTMIDWKDGSATVFPLGTTLMIQFKAVPDLGDLSLTRFHRRQLHV